MKDVSRLVPILAGVVAATGAWGLVVAGCGGDSTPNSSQEDASGEQDAGGMDATIDVVEDTLVARDTAPPSDASPGADADASAHPDADAGVSDSSTSVTAQSFPAQLAAARCNVVAACCGTTGDAATFDWQSCYNSMLPGGFQGSSTGSNLVDGGNVTFNPTQAQLCLDTFAAADCTSNEITSTEETQLFQACFAAYRGTLDGGSPCASTIECSPGNFCLPVDGGVGDAGAIGLCQALVGVGGPCALLGANQSTDQAVCSYRGSASNGAFCQNISGDAGLTQLPPAQWTCEPQFPIGTDCFGNQSCGSRICHQVGAVAQCETAGNWANAGTCALYVTDAGVVTDAGAGD
jgi:hypothetical protein